VAVEIKFGDRVKEGVEICKANLVPTILMPLIAGLAGMLVVAPAIVVQMVVDPTIGAILQIPLSFASMAVQGIFVINWMAAIKAAKHEGKKIEIGDLLNFENAVGKGLTYMLAGLGFVFCCIPGIMLLFAAPIMADKPGTGVGDVLKAAFAFGKGNIVPLLILFIVMIVLIIIGEIACGVGVLFTAPLAQATVFLAYDTHKASVEAAAAEAGVTLS